MSTNRWIEVSQHRPLAKLRLFCFPYAGGGASTYRAWPTDLPSSIELCALQLPARERRIHEPPLTDMAPLVEHVIAAIEPWLDRPFGFYGHSMGALIAYEVARALRRQRRDLPVVLFAAARRAPHLAKEKPHVHHMDDASLTEVIRRLNGTAASIINDQRVMSHYLPTIRADFALFENYRYVPESPLSCSIVALGGTSDAEQSQEELALWRKHTSGHFEVRLFPGGHFFHRARAKELLSFLHSRLEDALGSTDIAREGQRKTLASPNPKGALCNEHQNEQTAKAA